MKKSIFTSIIIFLFAFFGLASLSSASTSVRGYYKPSIGKYVVPSYRSSPSKTRYDNYSTKGNYNPYTGEKGTKSPYKY